MKRRALLIAATLVIGARAGEKLAFNRDIRPILSDKCFTCHGPDAGQRKGGLRLDEREAALRGGDSGPAVVPGNPDKSEILVRIDSTDRDEMMPPPKAHKPLTVVNRQLLRRWIAEGATYEPHWAFIPPQRPAIPDGERSLNARGSNPHSNSRKINPIDAFIGARLAQEHLMPALEADKTTLIRRVTLDLTGLPPTIAEVDAFLRDSAADAYERVVDRLLQSEHYGERMAVDWLDAARFADSNGYQVDRDRELWPWRDWVIRAFNSNMRFDQFTIEQLAGDLLPNPTLDQRIATGFHRNHMLNEEGGIIAEEFLAEYTADRVETTGTVWLAQTFNCARCHDHKYDPLTQRDFYSLKAFFHNVTEKGIGSYGAPIRVNAPPYLRLPTPEQTRELAALDAQLSELKAKLIAQSAEAAIHLDHWAEYVAKVPILWTPTASASIRVRNAELQASMNGVRIVGATAAPFEVECTTTIPSGRLTAFRIDCVQADLSGAGRWLDVRAFAAGKPIKLRAAECDTSLPPAELRKTLDDSRQTFIVAAPKLEKPVSGVFELLEPIHSERPVELRIEIAAGYGSGPMIWRVATTDSKTEFFAPASISAIAKKDREQRSAAEAAKLAAFHAAQQPKRRALDHEVTLLTQQRDAVERSVQTTLVMEEMKNPRSTFVLTRGAYDKPAEAVDANTPASLPPLDPNLPRNRLGLARWLVDPSNPLTARVTVNRLWQAVFGIGLVKTSEDFGSQGEPPSHPELLDWLATEFIRTGWDVKGLMRLMVTSTTYRQSSRLTPALRERDPENRLLARGSRFRLPAEMIRDQALAASGLLKMSIGGPSVRPYHPPGLYEQVVAGTGAATYVEGKGDELYRRSLYTYWKRSVPHPAMLTFDAPFREACTVRRPRTNTPLQALNLMNDPTYVEAARVLAQGMIRESNSVEGQLIHGFRTVLARWPKPEELTILTAGYQRALATFRSDTQAALAFVKVGHNAGDPSLDPASLAALTTVASTILNLDETVTKE